MDVISTYVGETGRQLNTRIKEHKLAIANQDSYNNKIFSTTQLQKHMFNHHFGTTPDWNIEILGKERSTQNRKIKEAIEIINHKPTLNNNSGVTLII